MRGLARTAAALAAAVLVTLIAAGGGAARHSTCYDPAYDTAATAFFMVQPIDGCGTTTPTYDWGVSPSYTGSYYPDDASAAAAEPPAPAPVTPALPTWRNLYDWPNGHGYVGWHTASSSQAGAYGMQAALGGQYGLWLWPVGGGSYSYANGNYAEWTYTAPGTTRLSSALLTFTYRNKLLAHHCIDIGFRDAAGAVVTHNEHCKPVSPPDSQRGTSVSLVDSSTAPTSKVLYVRIRVDCGGAATCSKNIPQLDPLSNGGNVRVTKVDMTLVDDDNPVVTPSGTFRDLDQNYDNGRSSRDLTIAASDAGAGIVRNWLERTGTGTIVSSNAPCDPTHHTDVLDNRICPPDYTFSTDVDMNQFPEGTNNFVAKSVDPAGNTGVSDDWTIFVDRTPPAVPSGIQLQGYDDLLRLGTIVWSESADPALPDGVPGSGLQRYLIRHQVNGGGFGDWKSIDGTSQTIAGISTGDTVDVELQSVDRVGNVSATGSATLIVPAATGPSGPVVTGSLVNGSGAPVSGEVAVYLNGADNTGQTPVGTSTVGADGQFALQLSGDAASAVADEAVQNSGWVNFDVIAFSGPLMFSGDVARRIDIGAWSDGAGSPDPLTITMAAGEPGVIGGGATARRLASSQRRLQFCPVLHYPVDTAEAYAPVGELHTGYNQSAFFEYGEQADSTVAVGVSEDGKIWKVKGSFHVSNTESTSTGHGIIYRAPSDWGKVLLSHFRFTKYQYFLGCNAAVKWWKVKATKWLVGQKLGADVHGFDHQCLSTYQKWAEPFLKDGSAYTHNQRAKTWDRGVSVFGASLDIRSGFSRWAHAEWHFGKKFNTYWLCGNDRDFADAPRIFAGA